MNTLLKPIKFNKNTGFKKFLGFLKTKRGLMLLLLPFVIFGLAFVYTKNHAKTTYAVDPLVVSYEGSGPPAPMFSVTGMLPGDEIEKVFNVENGGPTTVLVKIDGVKTNETNAYAGILDVEISQVSPVVVLFNGKLQSFFDAPPLSLGNLGAGADKNFRVKVRFPLSAGNEYQNALVQFNILWLTEGQSTSVTPTPSVKPSKTPSITPTQGAIVLPAECQSLQGKITKVVEGTDGNDNINASNASELILGKNGNDRISGSAGDDCIVGGAGEDRIQAGQGNDIVLAGDGDDEVNGNDDNDTIYGGAGEDELDGQSDEDKIYGGDDDDEITGGSGEDYIEGNSGNDEIRGDSGDDTVYGNEGNDEINVGQGDDTVFGGAGDDHIEGGSGEDELSGESGDDEIEGGSQEDTLNGGPDNDNLDGDSDTDTCTQGETLNSCEL